MVGCESRTRQTNAFSYEDANQAMLQVGMSESGAANMIELYRALNEGRTGSIEPRSAKSTTRSSAEAFSEQFANVYRDA